MSGPTRERLRPLALLIIGLVVAWLPQAGRLPVWVGVVLGVALVFRFYLAWAGKPLPRRLLLALPTLAGGYWAVRQRQSSFTSSRTPRRLPNF